jgi:hypothetical protein
MTCFVTAEADRGIGNYVLAAAQHQGKPKRLILGAE